MKDARRMEFNSRPPARSSSPPWRYCYRYHAEFDAADRTPEREPVRTQNELSSRVGDLAVRLGCVMTVIALASAACAGQTSTPAPTPTHAPASPTSYATQVAASTGPAADSPPPGAGAAGTV